MKSCGRQLRWSKRKHQIFKKHQIAKIFKISGRLRICAPGPAWLARWRRLVAEVYGASRGNFGKSSCWHPILPKLHQQEDLDERSPKTQTRAPREARRQGKIHFLKWIAGAPPRTPLPLPPLSFFLPLSPSHPRGPIHNPATNGAPLCI